MPPNLSGVVIIYLALTLLPGSSDLPAPWRRAISCFWSEPEATGPIWSCSRWGLPGHGVTTVPVSSYLAFSPLPRKEQYAPLTGRYIFCGTFRTPPVSRKSRPCYGPPCPVEFGLSSPPDCSGGAITSPTPAFTFIPYCSSFL